MTESDVFLAFRMISDVSVRYQNPEAERVYGQSERITSAQAAPSKTPVFRLVFLLGRDGAIGLAEIRSYQWGTGSNGR